MTMKLNACPVSCGIRELFVGSGYNQAGIESAPSYGITKTELDRIVRTTADPYDSTFRCSMIIASLRSDQLAGIQLLEANGFKRITQFRENPNTFARVAIWCAYVQGGVIVPFAGPEQETTNQ